MAGGGPFTKNRLYNLLTKRVYVGKIEFGGEVYDGEHEAILDPEVWQRVQDRLHLNGRTGGRQVRNKYGAVLKGNEIDDPAPAPPAEAVTRPGRPVARRAASPHLRRLPRS